MDSAVALLKALLLPPFGLILLTVAGWLVMRRRRRFGRALIITGLLTLYLISTPVVGNTLLRGLQAHPALSSEQPVQGAGAIVVLGADVRREAPEYGGETVGALTLARVRYGAKLYRDLGLPVLVTGGSTRTSGRPVGLAMQESLERDFAVPVRWVEAESRNTYENAKSSSDILKSAGVTKIYLVTHAWHMPRAVKVFEATGLEVVPAPTGFLASPTPELRDFIASASGLAMSYYALYEGVGYLWYSLTY